MRGNSESGVVGEATGVAEETLQPQCGLILSEASYRMLFERNPIPMWVFDRHTLRFLAVNEAAIHQYGYSEGEFLGMTIAQIRPEDAVPGLIRDIALWRQGLQKRTLWKHRRKDGSLIIYQREKNDFSNASFGKSKSARRMSSSTRLRRGDCVSRPGV